MENSANSAPQKDLGAYDAKGEACMSSGDQGSAQSHTPAGLPTPDGGLRAWLQAVGGFLVFFNLWGFPISYGAYQIFYELHYLSSHSASDISWIGTTQGALLILVGVFGGPLYDLGFFRELVYVGSLLAVFGLMMLSLATEYWQVFLAQGVCAGLGCGLLYVPALALVGGAFTKHRAIAMGFVTSGGALGGVIYTIMFQQLLPRLGFAWTTRIMAFAAFATFLASIPLLLYRPASTSIPNRSSANKARALLDTTALRSPTFILFTLAQFLVFAGYLVPLFYIPVFGRVALGLPNEFCLWVLVAAQATSLAGRVGASLLAQLIGSMVVWCACCAISGTLCLVWIAVTDKAGFVAFAALYGFITGGLVALPPTIFPLVSPDPKTLGTRMGMSWAATAIAFLVGSPIAGALSGGAHGMSFEGIQIWSGVLLLAGMAALGILWGSIIRQARNKVPEGTSEPQAASKRQVKIWI